LFHKSLEEFDHQMKKNDEDWMTISKERTFELIETIVDELVAGYNSQIFMSSYRFMYMIKKLKRVGKRAAWTLVTQVKQGDFLPYAHEIQFSTRGQDVVPPIVIELSNGDRMMLEGQIDRIDMYEEKGKHFIKIIDYKSGSKKFSLSEVYQGLQLQLMVYMDAILENHDYFKVDALSPAGVFYFKIDDPLLESELLKGDMTENEILKALKMDGILVEDINIAQAMDRLIIENRKSSVIPFELKKDDTISSRSKVAKEDEFYKLIDFVKETVRDIGDEISDGVTKIDPIKLGTMTGCQSCDYKSICQFDQSFGNRYHNLKNYKDDEVLEHIRERGDHAELDK
jgi:ATP-dependent helicase/nuclease subunit B